MEGDRLEPEGSENSVCETFSEPTQSHKVSKSEESWKRYETLDNVTLPPLPDFVITNHETDSPILFKEVPESKSAQSNVIRRSVSSYHVDNERLSIPESEPPSRSLSCSQLNKSSSGYSNKYAHVQSRVKQYIKNVKAKDLKARNAKLALSTSSFVSATDVTRSTLCWSSDEEVVSDNEDIETKLQKALSANKENERLLKNLHESYQELLSKHSQAEITIDRLRIQCGFGFINSKHRSTNDDDAIDFAADQFRSSNNVKTSHSKSINISASHKASIGNTPPPQESSSLSTWTSKDSNALPKHSISVRSAKNTSSPVPNVRITVSTSTQTICDSPNKSKMSVSTQTSSTGNSNSELTTVVTNGKRGVKKASKQKKLSERQKQILESFDQLNSQSRELENSSSNIRDQLIKPRSYSLGQ